VRATYCRLRQKNQAIPKRKKVMSKLFEKMHVKSLTISNRFIRSATWEGMATQKGACTQKLTAPLIREPDLVNRWRSGDRRKATFLSDNQCIKPAMAGEGIYGCGGEKGKTEE
jgi:2,4-dienoyl-CoA reductase-like NADH-dependent reductase (Old Yellow Enzyme family)